MSTSNCVPLCIRKQQTEQIINTEETHLKAQEKKEKKAALPACWEGELMKLEGKYVFDEGLL